MMSTNKSYFNSDNPKQAKFPVIDAHNHLWGNWDLDKVVEVMDEVGVKGYCDLTSNVKIKLSGGGYVINEGNIDDFVTNCVNKHPGRFFGFTMSNFARDSNKPLLEDAYEFVDDCIVTLNEHITKGAKGLKILKELGLKYHDSNGNLINVNDERLFPIWEEAAKLNIPVLIHQADPNAFFEPLTKDNEHYGSLKKYPAWSFADQKYPRKEQLLANRNSLIEQNPDTTFILPHVANHAEDLDSVANLLNIYPNIYIDFSARLDELGRKPYSTRKFFLDFQDRIIFGTDMPANLECSVKMYQTYFRFLETYDESFYSPDYDGTFDRARWPICGIGLPDEALKKIYSENILKLIPSLIQEIKIT